MGEQLTDVVEELLDVLDGAGLCPNQAIALRRAARNYDQANRARDAAGTNRVAGGVASGAGGAALAGCALAVTGVGALVCVGAGATAAISGILWWWSADESVDLADEEVDDAIDDVSSAIDDVCRCLREGQN